MNRLIEKFKTHRKRAYITKKNTKTYAFIGIGNHSINNLYPVINYYGLNIKYIVTKSRSNAELVDQNFPNSIGTNNLDEVLSDPEVSGVFISASPSSHYELIKKVLQADKHVFVEKPPCSTIEELNNLIKVEGISKGQCLVGFQKLYSPITEHLKQHSDITTYNYRFVTGSYPEGDVVLELFIHPISLVLYLFNDICDESIIRYTKGKASTYFLHLVHVDGTIGSIELSTNYSWVNAKEHLIINTDNAVYETENFDQFIQTLKMGKIYGLAREKLSKKKYTISVIESRNNFNPILQNNQLYSSGYVNEIERFIELCEFGYTNNRSTLISCRSIYSLINSINKIKR